MAAGRSRRRPLLSAVIENLQLALFGNAEVVGHGENSRYSVCTNVRHILVAFVIHHAGERYMPVVDDDMDRRLSTHSVPIQSSKSVNGAILRQSDAIIKTR